MPISREGPAPMPWLAKRLDRDGDVVRRRFGLCMIAMFSIVTGLSWGLAPDQDMWSLIASGDARSWLAIGERPVGFVAIGGQPTGVLAIGILPIGVFSMGLYSVGVFSAGFFTLGLVSSGGGSAGWLSLAYWGSLGWYSYSGGTSIGVHSWGRRAYGYCFASSPERLASRQPEEALLKATTSIRKDAPQRMVRILSGAAARPALGTW